MKLPNMKQLPQSRQTVEAFGGYNHNLRIGDGEFFEMENMTSSYYPVLSPRDPRGRLTYGAQALVSSHGLCRVENGRFYLPDGTDAGVSLSHGEKQLVAMGAYVIVLPDKVWINVSDSSEHLRSGVLESRYVMDTGTFSFRPCHADGTVYSNVTETEPRPPADGQTWLDATGEYPVLKQWSEATGMWCALTTGYVLVEAPGIGNGFAVGDSVQVRLQGVPLSWRNAMRHIGSVTYLDSPQASEKNLGEFTGTWVIRDKTSNSLVISGYLGKPVCSGKLGTGADAFPGSFVAERTLPDMDFVVECGNRLWGCKYGITENGFVNEIYASKLGDFKNFHSFQHISTDSYTASVGADGPFTGVASYMGHPVFFKENCMLEVFGNYPAAYQLQVTPCEGVQEGSYKSLAVVNNVLYYKSRGGICAYDGAQSVQVGQALGEQYYERAVAGGWGGKYYVSMYAPEEARFSLFVYDSSRRLWHREDSLQVHSFCYCGNTLYALDASGCIHTMDGSGTKDSTAVKWMVQTGKIGLQLPESKYVSGLTLRLSMALGSVVSVYAGYDSRDHWEHLYTVRGTTLDSITLPLRPRRCDHLQLKLEGTGEMKLYSITKTVEQGGEGL